MSSFRPISISLSPNTERDDIHLALKLFFKPWLWKRGESEEFLEKEFKNYLEIEYAISFNSGRSALLAILKSLDLKENNEILLQAFTCNAAVSPILWASLKPIFIDCDEKTFNIDITNLERTLLETRGKKSKVLMVQHTFGLPAEMDKILEICKKNNLILIEDCAHSLGAEYRGKKVGTFGDVAFFSFSRDKVISSVYGGIVVTNNENLAKKIKEFKEKIGYPSYFWIFQQLLHPVLMNYLILPTYSFLRTGKTLLIIFQWLKVLSKAVHWLEKRGKKPGYFPKRLPNALAILALNQFKKLDKFNQHRKKIAEFYRKELKETSFKLPTESEQIYLRFTIKTSKNLSTDRQAHNIIRKAWQQNILIGDWYTTAIAPHDTKLEKMGYKLGSCSKAEKLAKETFNLPTHINISRKEAEKIVDFLKNIK